TATHRKTKGDAARVVAERYRQMADHYGTAIVPARVKKRRDKAAVESAVHTVNKRVIGYLAEDVWTSLSDMNEAIAERVHEITHDIRRADDTTRFDRFASDEAPLLAALAGEVFQQVEWKQFTVQRNYHITADYQHYSVPFRLAGQVLRVRLTTSQVTVFDGHQVVAEHPRKTGRKGQYSTDTDHGPAQHRDISGLCPNPGSLIGLAGSGRPPRPSSSRSWSDTRSKRKAIWTAKIFWRRSGKRANTSWKPPANSCSTCAEWARIQR